MAAGGNHAPVRTGRVGVRGAELMVEVVGASGPAFLWSHAMLSCRAQEDQDGLFRWHDIAEQQWRWVRYDARGHGESTGTTNVAAYSWGEAGRDLLGLADALGIPRFAGGGVSSGCAALLEATLTAPDRVDRLVLVAPPAAWGYRYERVENQQRQAARLRSLAPGQLAGRLGDGPRPPLLAASPGVPPFEGCVPGEWVAAVVRGAAASDLPAAEALAGLEQPALILVWDADPDHPVATAQQLAELLPRSDFYIARTFRQLHDWPHLVAQFLGAGI